MRRLACLSIISVLALPAIAMAQDASAPPPPQDQPGMLPLPPYQQDMQPMPDEGSPPPGAPGAPGGKHNHDGGMRKWQARFDAANTSHDGRLTLEQAQAAGLKPVVAHFSAIDTQNRGYVTFNEIMAWHLEDEAQKMERRAAALRAQD
jgi:hypothetical protein